VTARVSWYQYQTEHSPTHTHPDHQTSFINFLHLLRSIASSSFKLHAWQSYSSTSLQILFGLHLGLGHSISYSIHFFTHQYLLLATHAHCPHHHDLFCYSTENRIHKIKDKERSLIYANELLKLSATHSNFHSLLQQHHLHATSRNI